MNRTWRIINGQVIDPVNNINQVADLFIVDGIITPENQFVTSSTNVIDAKGCLVMPGLVDMHVHFREPGQEYKEDVRSGAKAASHGGFTAVACMPNTTPVNDNASVCRMILERARQADCRVYPIGTISKKCKGKELAEFGELKESGAVGVSDDGLPVSDSQLMRRALEYASDFNLTVIGHCEDESLSSGVMNESEVSTRLGLKGIPSAAEAVMVYRDIALAEFTGRPVHIAHVSTKMSVSLIREAKARGVRVTAETAPHYFSLTDKAVEGYSTNTKMNPPLRSAKDLDAIIAGLKDGTLDAIATDHAPHSVLEKELEFDAAAFGIIGLETAVPLTFALVRQGAIDMYRMVELMSVNPAKILGVEGGSLTPGTAADITILNPHEKFTYTIEDVTSKSKNSPFLDWQLEGRAALTMVGGEVKYSRLSF